MSSPKYFANKAVARKSGLMLKEATSNVHFRIWTGQRYIIYDYFSQYAHKSRTVIKNRYAKCACSLYVKKKENQLPRFTLTFKGEKFSKIARTKSHRARATVIPFYSSGSERNLFRSRWNFFLATRYPAGRSTEFSSVLTWRTRRIDRARIREVRVSRVRRVGAFGRKAKKRRVLSFQFSYTP